MRLARLVTLGSTTTLAGRGLASFLFHRPFASHAVMAAAALTGTGRSGAMLFHAMLFHEMRCRVTDLVDGTMFGSATGTVHVAVEFTEAWTELVVTVVHPVVVFPATVQPATTVPTITEGKWNEKRDLALDMFEHHLKWRNQFIAEKEAKRKRKRQTVEVFTASLQRGPECSA